MILLLDTSTSTCLMVLVDGGERTESSWEAGRDLSKGLLGFIESELKFKGRVFDDISALGAYRGPGSFTGLRIGLTVLNTLADSLGVPIVGEVGENWQETALRRLEDGDNDWVVLPLYGGEAHITSPRK